MAGITWRVGARASVLILALVLALGATLPALAQEEGLEQRGFSGTVTAVFDGGITVETEDGDLVTAATTEDTKVRLPSKEVQSVLEVELKAGAEVAMLAQVEADGSRTALWVLVKPERPQVEHLLGTVISIEGNIITIVDAQGNEHTVEMPEQALQGLQVGAITTLVVEQPDADGEEPENPVASAAVSAKQIQERVAAHAEALRERAQAGDIPVHDADERIQFLTELMDIIQQHMEGVLTAVLDQVTDQAKATIEQAMEQARKGFAAAKEAISETRGQVSPPEEAGPPEETGGPPEEAGPPEGAGAP